MRVEYQMTPRALLAGSRLLTNPFWLAPMLAGGFLVPMLAMTALEEGLPCLACAVQWVARWALGAVSFGVVMTALYWFVLLPIRAHRLCRQNPLVYGDSALSAEAEGFTLRTPRTTAEFAWRDLRGFKENSEVFVLSVSRSAGLVVAKAGIAAADLQALSTLLGEKLRRL